MSEAFCSHRAGSRRNALRGQSLGLRNLGRSERAIRSYRGKPRSSNRRRAPSRARRVGCSTANASLPCGRDTDHFDFNAPIRFQAADDLGTPRAQAFCRLRVGACRRPGLNVYEAWLNALG